MQVEPYERPISYNFSFGQPIITHVTTHGGSDGRVQITLSINPSDGSPLFRLRKIASINPFGLENLQEDIQGESLLSENGYTGWQSSLVFNNLPAGNYSEEGSIRVPFSHGRFYENKYYGSRFELNEPPPSIIITEASCTNKVSGPSENDGEITISYINSNLLNTNKFAVRKQGYDSGWQYSNVITGLAPGIYTAHAHEEQTLYDATPFSNIEVEVLHNPLSLTFIKSTALCNGSATGTATIRPSGGTNPHTYNWSDGGTGNIRNNLNAGAYTVNVRDAVGFEKYIQFTIDQPAPITAEVFIDGGDIRLEVIGGTTPYTYAWSDGLATPDRESLPSGNYQVTISDNNACTLIKNAIIEDLDFLFDGNIINLDIVAENIATKPNLSFRAEIFIEKNYNSNNFESVLSIEQPADINGKTTFQTQEVISGFVNRDTPDPSTRQMTRTNSFKRFYLKHNEKYGTPPTHHANNQIETRMVARGGLNEQEYLKQSFFNSYLPTYKPFLTWWPTDLVKPVFPEQIEFLYFPIISTATTSISIKVEVIYSDKTIQIISPLDTITGVRRNEIYRVPVSPRALNLTSRSKKVVKYNIWIENQNGTSISQTHRYRMENNRVFFRQFLFENSLGAFETLVSLSPAKGTLKVKTVEVTKTLLPDTPFEQGSVEVQEKTGIVERKLSMYKSNLEAEHLQDFALSRYVFEIRNRKLYPVRIKCSPKFIDEYESINLLEFTVTNNLSNFYTPVL